MPLFRMTYADQFKRRPDGEVVNERRPHIIPTSPEAADFLVRARTDNRCFRSLIGPMSLGGLGEANVGGVWVPSLRYLPVEAQEPNFEINLVEMTVKLERRMDQYERTRLVTLELETDLDPDTLFDRVNCLNTATLYSKSGQLLGEVLRVKDDPLEVSA